MSSSLLDKLRVKPIPKQKSSIMVGLHKGEAAAREAVRVATTLVDKREKQIGRDIGQIRRRLAESKVVADVSKPESAVEDAVKSVEEDIAPALGAIKEDVETTDVPKPTDIADIADPAEESKPQDDEQPVEAPVKPKATIKRARKVKLVVQDDGAKETKDPEPAAAAVVAAPKRKLRVTEGPLSLLKIGDTVITDRLPEKRPDVLVKASSYYMSNREIFINFITSLFRKYKEQIDSESSNVSCEQRQTSGYEAMAHQNLVRDYLNIYTPYRGLLLYHGLGSGKTCTSIGIAEGLKSHKQVLVMTPASLRANFYKELKKCGDPLFRRNQFWEFVRTVGDTKLTDEISKALSLPVEIIQRQKGAWLVNVNKPANYTSLTGPQQRQLDEQLNAMIETKYQFINYNGLRKSHLQTMTSDFSKNPFDGKVVVIEEAHNFVSRIANKLTSKASGSLSLRLYEYLMSAKDCKVVMLTGTPIINYPNELGIMFNILRGYIKTFSFKLNVLSERKVSEDTLRKMLSS